LDRQSYSRRLLRVSIYCCVSNYRNLSLTAPGRYQIQYIVPLNLAESCVFDKQSPLPALCPCARNIITLTGPLLPKLRGHFAEFLQHYYPIHLSILYQSTYKQCRVRSIPHNRYDSGMAYFLGTRNTPYYILTSEEVLRAGMRMHG